MFLYTISCMQGGHTTLTLIFIIFYMTAALLQVRTGRGTGAGARAALHGWEGRSRLGPERVFQLFLCDCVASKHWTGAQENRL